MSDSVCFLAVKAIYFNLDDNFNQMIAACTSDEQRNQVRFDYVTARDNFYEARNRVFIDDDPTVQAVTQQLQQLNVQILNDLQSLTAITATLKTIDTAVSLASRLIMLGSVAL